MLAYIGHSKTRYIVVVTVAASVIIRIHAFISFGSNGKQSLFSGLYIQGVTRH